MQNVEDQIYDKLFSVYKLLIIFMKVSSLMKLIYLQNSKINCNLFLNFYFEIKFLLDLADTNE